MVNILPYGVFLIPYITRGKVLKPSPAPPPPPFPLPLFPLSPFPLPLSLLLGRRRHLCYLSLIPAGRGGTRKSSINRLLADFLRGGGSLRFDRGEAGFIVGERGRHQEVSDRTLFTFTQPWSDA